MYSFLTKLVYAIMDMPILVLLVIVNVPLLDAKFGLPLSKVLFA